MWYVSRFSTHLQIDHHQIIHIQFSGWPAFYDCIEGAVKRFEDRSHGMIRTEIVCANCGGHLGHVFKGERYPTPTDERYANNNFYIL